MANHASGRLAALLKPFSAGEIAQAGRVSAESVWRWQTGATLPQKRFLSRIAAATNIDIETLREAWVVDAESRKGRS